MNQSQSLHIKGEGGTSYVGCYKVWIKYQYLIVAGMSVFYLFQGVIRRKLSWCTTPQNQCLFFFSFSPLQDSGIIQNSEKCLGKKERKRLQVATKLFPYVPVCSLQSSCYHFLVVSLLKVAHLASTHSSIFFSSKSYLLEQGP